MKGETVTVEEAEKYQTAVLMALGKAYHRLNIDGDATEIWVQTYDKNGSYVGSWYDGWYYKK